MSGKKCGLRVGSGTDFSRPAGVLDFGEPPSHPKFGVVSLLIKSHFGGGESRFCAKKVDFG